MTATMDPPDVLHAFWRRPSPPGNDPRDYLMPVGRSQALVELLGDLPAGAAILEVGCNVGRNLAHLYDCGWGNLTGVEISPHAVEVLRFEFPQLAGIPVHVGAAEDVLPGLPAGYDLVVTMAVLQHIHPDRAVVFDEIARLGASVLAIEPAGRSSHRSHPHDIPQVFRDRGMTLVSSRPMAHLAGTAGDKAMAGYVAYRFARPPA